MISVVQNSKLPLVESKFAVVVVHIKSTTGPVCEQVKVVRKRHSIGSLMNGVAINEAFGD